MASPTTFSGFNSIDVGQILNAIMTAEAAPMTALLVQKTALNTQNTAYTAFAAKLGVLQSALDTLTSTGASFPFNAPGHDSDAVGVMTTTGGIPATYEVIEEAPPQSQLHGFVKSYNDLMSFFTDQTTAAANGTPSIAGDDMVCSLTAGLRDALLNKTFGSLQSQVERYTKSGGLIQGAKDRLQEQIVTIDSRLDSMQLQLDLRLTALRQQFTAADLLMTQLKSQASSLDALNGQDRLFEQAMAPTDDAQ
jgi:flagellar capping protein FliD